MDGHPDPLRWLLSRRALRAREILENTDLAIEGVTMTAALIHDDEYVAMTDGGRYLAIMSRTAIVNTVLLALTA